MDTMNATATAPAPQQPETTPAILKEQRARDAAAAMREYEAERLAVLAQSARLRALRLARAAAAKAAPPPAAKVTKARAKRPVRQAAMKSATKVAKQAAAAPAEAAQDQP